MKVGNKEAEIERFATHTILYSLNCGRVYVQSLLS